ncbi:MAG: rhodanese-like domain-containing protein [candidate division Zixibacteria bacterium]|nr:rhodanese-like domain-containing protein [candidate division Zixibacteria bacterium]
MNRLVKQLLIIIILSTLVGLLRNSLFPNEIAIIGEWRDLSNGEEPVIPPTAEKGDPPFIAINVAQMEYSTKGTKFIDARDFDEYECGTIPGSINIPFDYLPEGDLKPYFDSLLGGIPLDYPLIIYCSGEECDLSLHLGRNFMDVGYSNIMIFFGGSREWESYGLEVERISNCEE